MRVADGCPPRTRPCRITKMPTRSHCPRFPQEMRRHLGGESEGGAGGGETPAAHSRPSSHPRHRVHRTVRRSRARTFNGTVQTDRIARASRILSAARRPNARCCTFHRTGPDTDDRASRAASSPWQAGTSVRTCVLTRHERRKVQLRSRSSDRRKDAPHEETTRENHREDRFQSYGRPDGQRSCDRSPSLPTRALQRPRRAPHRSTAAARSLVHPRHRRRLVRRR